MTSSPSAVTVMSWLNWLYWNTIGSRESSPNSTRRSFGSSRAARRTATASGVSPAMPISRSGGPGTHRERVDGDPWLLAEAVPGEVADERVRGDPLLVAAHPVVRGAGASRGLVDRHVPYG